MIEEESKLTDNTRKWVNKSDLERCQMESLITKNQLVIDKIVLVVHFRLAMWIQTLVVLQVLGFRLLDKRRQDGGDGGHVEEDQVRVAVGDVDTVIPVDNRVRVQENLVLWSAEQKEIQLRSCDVQYLMDGTKKNILTERVFCVV